MFGRKTFRTFASEFGFTDFTSVNPISEATVRNNEVFPHKMAELCDVISLIIEQLFIRNFLRFIALCQLLVSPNFESIKLF